MINKIGVILLFFLLPGNHVLSQGYERLLNPNFLETGPNWTVEQSHALPDGALLYTTRTTLGLIDADGNLAWKRDLPGSDNHFSLTVEDEDIWLLAVTNSQLDTTSYIQIGHYDLAGQLISSQREVLRDFGGTSRFFINTNRFATKTGPNEFELIIASTSTEEAIGSTSFDTLHYLRLDTLTQIIEEKRLGFDCENCTGFTPFVQRLTDGSFALGIREATRKSLYHFYPNQDSLLWIKDIADAFSLVSLQKDEADNIYVSYKRDGPQNVILQFEFQNHTLLDSMALATTGVSVSRLRDVMKTNDGGYILFELQLCCGDIYPEGHFLLHRYDANFSYQVSHAYAFPTNGSMSLTPGLGLLPNGNPYAFFWSPGGPNEHLLLVTDTSGLTYGNLLTGTLYFGEEEECLPNSDNPGLADWWIEATPLDTTRPTAYGFTSSQGEYRIRLDTGQYDLRAVALNAYWTSCPPILLDIGGPNDTLDQDLTTSVAYECPLLQVDIATPVLYRCQPSSYYVQYENVGTLISEPSLIEVTLDSLFEPTLSEPAWDEREGQILRYNLPPVDIGEEGRIVITGQLDCAASAPEQAHCTDVHVYPDSLCTPPGINWDGSSIEVSGFCQNDTVLFRITNVGTGDMTSISSYTITEDYIIHRGGEFQLEAGEFIELDVSSAGSTYRLAAEQSPGHPGSSMPTSTVEGCGNIEGQIEFVRGIYTSYLQDEGDPFVAIECRQNFMPDNRRENDLDFNVASLSAAAATRLTVSPRGIGPLNFIEENSDLEYLIAVENTGDRTYDEVWFLDTLSTHLDPTSLIPGVSSHPLEFSVSPLGVARFDFPDLSLLPGETAFVQFKVSQKENVPFGVEIHNRALVRLSLTEVLKSDRVTVRVRKPEQYGFVNRNECILDLNAPMLNRTLDTLSFATYDSITLTTVNQLPAYRLEIDTNLIIGDTLVGMIVTGNGVYTDSLTTRDQCDSLLVYFVTAGPNAINDYIAGSLAVYPNPASTYLVLRSDQALIGPLQIIDQLGRVYPVRRPTNSDEILISIAGLPPGNYVLTGNTARGKWRRRIVKF